MRQVCLQTIKHLNLSPFICQASIFTLFSYCQMWEDEEERKRILSEKHARGAVARSNREARVLERDMRKVLKSDR